MKLATLQACPDWPARMTADVAAIYMGVSKSTFLTRFGKQGVKEGANILWARRQLDAYIAKQFALAQPRARGADGEDDETWADFK